LFRRKRPTGKAAATSFVRSLEEDAVLSPHRVMELRDKIHIDLDIEISGFDLHHDRDAAIAHAARRLNRMLRKCLENVEVAQ
jgi:hypothetical protein